MQNEKQTEQKKSYEKPEVAKHGNVESLTQGVAGSSSNPVIWQVST